jgi:phage/plasmid-associated DNA primase
LNPRFPPRFSCLSRLLKYLGGHLKSLKSFKTQHNVALKRLASGFNSLPARGICRSASSERSDAEKTTAIRLASKSTSAAVERLAAADRRHAAVAEQWDADPWLLNTPKGTLDLRTGQIGEHRRSDYITKITAAGPGTECPLWRHFLDRVTGGDVELQSFLQRMIGYSLTGITREHAFFFLYGTGANGKSGFLSTISALDWIFLDMRATLTSVFAVG